LELDPRYHADRGATAFLTDTPLDRIAAHFLKEMSEHSRGVEQVSRLHTVGPCSRSASNSLISLAAAFFVFGGDALRFSKPCHGIRKDTSGNDPIVSGFDPFQAHSDLDPALSSEPGRNSGLELPVTVVVRARSSGLTFME
jgi:hypothetical protein